MGEVTRSRNNTELILHIIVTVKSSEWADDVFDIEGSSTLEEIVGAFFEGDTFEGIQPTFIALLKLFRECFVRVICASHHVDHNSERR